MSHLSSTNENANRRTTNEVRICSVQDYQVLAQRKLSKALYEYLASGSDDEQTLTENRAAFKGWFLRPRVMRPVSRIDTSTTIVFPHCVPHRKPMRMSFPLFVSPAGVHALCDAEHGECATVRACATIQIPFGLSQHATRTMEQVAKAAKMSNSTTPITTQTTLWYQAYILQDRRVTERLIERAVAAGYQGIVLTVDSVRFGFREADARNGFDALPPPHRLVHYDDDRAGLQQKLPGQSGHPNRSSLEETYNGRKHQAWDQNSELLFDQNLSWDDVRWLKQETGCRNLPLIIKGIMTPEDALLAVGAGADAIIVSNHGGRQLDGCLGTLDVLEDIVNALAGTGIPVFLDGGVRRGTDIFKALALGAAAVGIGKPVFFALAVNGESAVTDMLRLLQRELEAAMALTGCRTVADISRDLVTRHPYGAGHSGSAYKRAAL